MRYIVSHGVYSRIAGDGMGRHSGRGEGYLPPRQEAPCIGSRGEAAEAHIPACRGERQRRIKGQGAFRYGLQQAPSREGHAPREHEAGAGAGPGHRGAGGRGAKVHILGADALGAYGAGLRLCAIFLFVLQEQRTSLSNIMKEVCCKCLVTRKKGQEMREKRLLSVLAIFCLMVVSCSVAFAANAGKQVVGIAWRADTDSEFFTNICRAVEEAGGAWVMLPQVRSADLAYNEAGQLTAGVANVGMLDEASAKYVRLNTWHDSNAGEALQDISIVLFTGGEDISPALYYRPENWHGIVSEIDYNAERDVSDYLTMTYCLDHDIPVVGFCRGAQMLGVVSGVEVIGDIPGFFAEQGKAYKFEHRNEKATPGSYRDYAPHEVQVAKDSLLYDIVGRDTINGCPSWHHQAIKNVDNTRLVVTGYTETNGLKMIEAVERKDKTFAIGVQFHPEAALVKHLNHAKNERDFMNYDTALSFFQRIVRESAKTVSKAA